MRSIPPLTALKCFEAAARLSSVTLAAQELHVTHSAVSQQIRLLEETLNVTLFQREPRGLKLTEAGRLYALDVRMALLDIAKATQLARARPQEGELVVGTLPSFALHWLVPRLPGFRATHPQDRIRLHTSLEVQDLRSGLVDVSIRMGPGHWPDLMTKKLFEDRLLVVASPRFQGGTLPTTAAEVAQVPLVCASTASWDDWFEAAGVSQRPDTLPFLTANDSNIVLGAVALGQGIALERHSLVAGALDRGELVQITNITIPYPYPYWVVWPPRDEVASKQARFVAWLEAEVSRYLSGLQSGTAPHD
ncbi:LysR substrate-binding domain-containing protein [Rhodoferax sp.]|uniref:LysR substrate-binding domain-containing protein n=1 Tax=Rhodoferax sp. TaxID=50421 RepID=UPI002851688B|nr:LysR substrate-binding domain-containing protein [Rhodoferax sp.]MDR3371314.1 LysR substrate-binding domain-containing protein [Rhodoferax sp.]